MQDMKYFVWDLISASIIVSCHSERSKESHETIWALMIFLWIKYCFLFITNCEKSAKK